MAAYRWVYDSRHLRADCQEPRSAPEPYMLGNRVWATFTYSNSFIFTVRRYESAVYAVALCPSVCHKVGVLPKWLNIESRKQHHTIAQGLKFFDVKGLCEIRPGSIPTGAPNAGVVG